MQPLLPQVFLQKHIVMNICADCIMSIPTMAGSITKDTALQSIEKELRSMDFVRITGKVLILILPKWKFLKMELLPHRLTDIFSTEVVLENDRVLLRPLQQQDVYLLLPFAEQEPEIWKYSAVTAAGKDGMCEYVNTALQMRDAGKEYPFIVFDKQSDSYAGCTRFYDINPDFSTIQLGYTWYGKSFQATGLNRNC